MAKRLTPREQQQRSLDKLDKQIQREVKTVIRQVSQPLQKPRPKKIEKKT